MNLDLNEEQAVLAASLDAILQHHRDVPQAERLKSSTFDTALWRKLSEGGFLDAGREMGTLEAVMVVLETSRLPVVAETGASALVVPQLVPEGVPGPVALLSGDLRKAQRMLSVARTALVDTGDDVIVLPVDPAQVEPVETILAYPYGRFRAPPRLEDGRRLGPAAREVLRHWGRVALAAECAGAAEAAVDFTVDYVKQRIVFGKPLGSLQAVQHRLAQCHQIARGMRYVALYAGWKADALSAAVAASYAQQHIQKLVFDLHQFNGGMGVTFEHNLHRWTYRLRALQSEMGGADQAGIDVTQGMWGKVA